MRGITIDGCAVMARLLVPLIRAFDDSLISRIMMRAYTAVVQSSLPRCSDRGVGLLVIILEIKKLTECTNQWY